MDYLSLKPRAKINVFLDVIGKRPDGYHDLKMIMQSLRLHDHLFIKKTGNSTIHMTTNLPYLPTNDKNLVCRVCRYMMDTYALPGGLYIDLVKNIPVSAGLGGGSSNAASALLGMRTLFNLPLTDEALLEIGKSFGADIPFFIKQVLLRKGSFTAEGIGEQLTPLPDHPNMLVLLCKPNINVSTADIFSALSVEGLARHPDMEVLVQAFRRGDTRTIAANTYNALETVTCKLYPVIEDIKAVMLKSNALTARMSGSGPTVFGYFNRRHEAIAAIRAIRHKVGPMRQVILTDVYPCKRRYPQRSAKYKDKFGGNHGRKF